MTENEILDCLREVIDPEIGVSIVDLGLVYLVESKPKGLYIQLTMTSPTCPLSGIITRNMDQVLHKTFPELGEITIELVWSPPWSPEMMSQAAKNQLGWN